MLEIIKYGTSKFGDCWVIGNLKYEGFEVSDLFNTNIKDENFFKDKTTIKVKKIKVSRNSKSKLIRFTLEF